MTGHCEVLVRRQIEAPKPPDSATRRSWSSPAGRSVRVPRPAVAPRGTSDHSPLTVDPVTKASKTLQNCSPGCNTPPLRPSHQRASPIWRKKYIPPSFAIQVPVRLEPSGAAAGPGGTTGAGAGSGSRKPCGSGAPDEELADMTRPVSPSGSAAGAIQSSRPGLSLITSAIAPLILPFSLE